MIFAWVLACSGADLSSLTVAGKPLSVEIADNGEERAMGLMYRESMPESQGMLFVYDSAEPRSFWMKNTRIPLSIAFIDSNGVIISISDMKPMDTHGTASAGPAQYALEVNQGWYTRNGIKVGDKVEGIPAGSD